jgi:hypothetical protein
MCSPAFSTNDINIDPEMHTTDKAQQRAIQPEQDGRRASSGRHRSYIRLTLNSPSLVSELWHACLLQPPPASASPTYREEARPHYFRFLLTNPNGEALLADIARP